MDCFYYNTKHSILQQFVQSDQDLQCAPHPLPHQRQVLRGGYFPVAVGAGEDRYPVAQAFHTIAASSVASPVNWAWAWSSRA